MTDVPDRKSKIKIAAVGEILVEMVARTRGDGFFERQDFVGPFPSGAPAIFIDQAAKLGLSSTIFGAVGNDDFGRVNLDRLTADGVDTSNIVVQPGLPTGIAFVRYRPNGTRDFLFTMHGSASALIPDNATEDNLNGITHLHVMGSGLGSPRIARFVKKAIPIIKQRGGTISLDPNVRPELMADAENGTVGAQLIEIAGLADFLLPSEGEVAAFGRGSDDEIITGLVADTHCELVLKRGNKGAKLYTREGSIEVPARRVEELDPTGAGDCFGATYVSMRLLGYKAEEALQHAVAAGANAVTHFGPMEGNITMSDLRGIVKTA